MLQSAEHYYNNQPKPENVLKMCQRYFCPVQYSTKTKPKTYQKTNPNPLFFLGLDLGLRLELGLDFWLVLGFVFVMYSAGQKYRSHIFGTFSGLSRYYLVLNLVKLGYFVMRHKELVCYFINC